MPRHRLRLRFHSRKHQQAVQVCTLIKLDSGALHYAKARQVVYRCGVHGLKTLERRGHCRSPMTSKAPSHLLEPHGYRGGTVPEQSPVNTLHHGLAHSLHSLDQQPRMMQSSGPPSRSTTIGRPLRSWALSVGPAQRLDQTPQKNRQRRLEPQGSGRFFLLFDP